MPITCYDSATNSQFPPGGEAYAGYVDGGIGDQPNYAWIVSAFPKAHHLSIALYGSDNADALDVEFGAARPADIPMWYARQVARGVVRPVIYASVSVMRLSVLPLLPGMAGRRLWTAHYGQGAHICGPKSCGQLPIDADGTQWSDRTDTATVDVSLLADDFFGAAPVAPHPVTWTEIDMSKIRVLRQGDADAPGQFWAVRRLQSLLFCAGHVLGVPDAVVACDGQFGPKTGIAVRAVEGHYRRQFPQMVIDPAGHEVAGAQVWGVLLTGQPQ